MIRIIHALGLLTVVLALTACGAMARFDARNDMLRSKAVYDDCLTKNPTNVKACQASHLTYEADLQAYRAAYATRRY